jgi:hypothetical protein
MSNLKLKIANWSGKRDSNPRPSAWKADALPLSYSRILQFKISNCKLYISSSISLREITGGEGRIRTSEGFAGRFTVCSLWPLGNLSDKSSKARKLENSEVKNIFFKNFH